MKALEIMQDVRSCHAERSLPTMMRHTGILAALCVTALRMRYCRKGFLLGDLRPPNPRQEWRCWQLQQSYDRLSAIGYFHVRQPCGSAAQHQMNMAADARLSAIGYRLFSREIGWDGVLQRVPPVGEDIAHGLADRDCRRPAGACAQLARITGDERDVDRAH